ncbi:MAG: hypothetical protein NTV80_03100 [Verrucomicrobia bacterium]|nr:hypothetical protein [Verrucomicrobiota bacterium]
MKTTIFLWGCCFWHLSLCLLSAAEPTLLRFYDETTMRHLSLAQEGFGRTTVTVRAASDPGNSGTWVGNGDRKDKTLLFSRIVGEGEDRGTVFLAEISESKVKIDYKPGQREPMDATINGEYRRTSEAKFLQLAKKEFQAANDRLVKSLKAATKIWQASDRPALLLWKEQWPALRERWISAALPQAPATAGSKPAAPASTEKPAEHWLYLAQATTQAFYFLSYLPDPKTGLGWDGEYDDLGGGHASVRLSKDGKLRLSLSSIRPNETEARTLDATAQPDKVMTAKNGELTAEFTVTDPEAKDPIKLPRIRLKKIGRYLQVETEQAQGNAGRGWFDGIYRGSPVPEG